MGTTTKLLHKREGRYAAIHVSMSGYPAGVGRMLLDHFDTREKVDALFAQADAADSRYTYSMSPDWMRLEPGERDISIPDFDADELAKRLKGYSFFLFGPDGWLWADADVAGTLSDYAAADRHLSEEAVIAMMKPIAQAVEEDQAPAREARQAMDDLLDTAQNRTLMGVGVRLLVSDDGSRDLQAYRGADFETIDPMEVAAFAQGLLLLARQAKFGRP